MEQEQQKELTGYPSIDRPWLKYYSEEAYHTPLPQCSIYQFFSRTIKTAGRLLHLIISGKSLHMGKFFWESKGRRLVSGDMG